MGNYWGTASQSDEGRKHGCSDVATQKPSKLLPWAREHLCPWEEESESEVSLRIRQWARERERLNQWNEESDSEGGSLLLEWAREHRCTWDEESDSEGSQLLNVATSAQAASGRQWLPVEQGN